METYLNIVRNLAKAEDTDLAEPQLVSDMDLVHNDPEASNGPDPVYVGDPDAQSPKPRRNNLAVYGRKFRT